MIRAVVIKELREVALFAALALFVGLAYVSALTGMKLFNVLEIFPREPADVPFVGASEAIYFGVIGGGLAVVLGFRQSYWETFTSTALFLFHRPLSRGMFLWLKLATGIVTVLVCTAFPILLYAWWAAAPGHHAGPFDWSMTAFTWQVWLTLPLAYLAAFAGGIRNGRWFGSRLLPTGAGLFAGAVLQFLPWWWMLGLPLVVLLSVVYLGVISFEAHIRDY